MYSLTNFQPYTEALERQKELREQIEEARAVAKGGQARLKVLDERAVEMASAGPEGYREYQKNREELQLKIAQEQEQGRVLEGALVVLAKEIDVQRKAAQAVVRQKAREEHGPIVKRAAAAIEELADALAEEQKLIQAIHPAVGPETGLHLLVNAVPASAGQLRQALKRIQERGRK